MNYSWKYEISITVLKYDEVIKKVTQLVKGYYFGYFIKDLMYYQNSFKVS